MDKEQINELKQGDEVLIRGMFEKIKDNGDFQISYLLTTVHGKLYMYRAAVHPSAVIINSPPKHDPTRLYKKWDRVKPRAGRDVYACEWEDAVFHKLTGVYELEADEKEGHVTIFDNETGTECYVSVFAIELVTPVEKLDPYSVKETMSHDGWQIVRDGLPLAIYDSQRHPNAKAAAEAECDRLNEKYRKEQK